MSDLISRQAAIDAVTPFDDEYRIRDAIEDLPSAQPERKRGKWKMDLKRHVFVCSICGAWQVFNCNYCSNCGTDMREVDE